MTMIPTYEQAPQPTDSSPSVAEATTAESDSPVRVLI